MPSLDGAVGGSVVCGCEPDLYIEGLHDIFVEIGDERVPVVTDGQAGDPIPAGPLHEGPAALGGGGVDHRIAFDPPTGPIQDT